jgi:hypothetical protein
MPESVVFDEILARELVIVDGEGRARIRLSLAGDGCAEMIVTDEDGAFVSMTAGVSDVLGVRVDDNRQAVELNAGGLDVSVAGTGHRLTAMEERVERVREMVERLTGERDAEEDDRR